MTLGGWIILLISVSCVTVLFVWCVHKVMTIPGETAHMHGVEFQTPDEKIEE